MFRVSLGGKVSALVALLSAAVTWRTAWEVRVPSPRLPDEQASLKPGVSLNLPFHELAIFRAFKAENTSCSLVLLCSVATAALRIELRGSGKGGGV